MHRQSLDDEYWDWDDPYGTPRSRNLNNHYQRPVVSERKLAVYGIILSLMVITVKVFSLYSDDIAKAFFEQKLITHEVLTENGQEMLMYTWKKVLKRMNLWLAVLFGLLSGYFTWMMVYLDSHLPGIQPPSPFSPKQYKLQSGHTFHLNYVFAVLVGVLVFFYIYYKSMSLQY